MESGLGGKGVPACRREGGCRLGEDVARCEDVAIYAGRQGPWEGRGGAAVEEHRGNGVKGCGGHARGSEKGKADARD